MEIALGGDEPVIIRGDAEELQDLLETVQEAIDDGQGEGSIITAEGVAPLLVQRDAGESAR